MGNDDYYEYYKHGPLARSVIGQQQGIDYTYTLQGRLKGVNSAVLTPLYDMRGDGANGSLVARDAFGFGLHYFGNRDYAPVNTSVKPFAAAVGNRSLFNRNISAISQNITTIKNQVSIMCFICKYLKSVQWLFVFTIIVYCTSCKENQTKIVTIRAAGLFTDSLNIGPMLFLNRDTGFIAGSSLVNARNPDYPEKDDREYLRIKWESKLFKTIDGGKNWTSKIFGEGHITQMDRFGDSIITLMRNDHYTRVFTSTVYNPDNWREITSFPRYVSHVSAYEDQMVAIAHDSLGHQFFFCFSDNGGKDWANNYYPIHDPYQYPVLKDGKLFYLARFERDQNYPDSLVLYDIHSHTDTLIRLPKDFFCLGLTCIQNSIYLTGMMNGEIAIYSLDANSQFRKLYTYAANNIDDQLRFYKSRSADWILAVKKRLNGKKIVIIKTSDKGKSFETSIVR